MTTLIQPKYQVAEATADLLQGTLNGTLLAAAGDSLSHNTYPIATITSLSRNGDYVTINTASTPTWTVGATIDVVNVTDSMTGRYEVTSGSGTSWQYYCPGPNEAGQLIGNAGAADLTKYSDQGFLNWALGCLMGRFELGLVSAGTGRTTSQILAKLWEVTASDAVIVSYLGGTNNVLGGIATSTTISDIMQSLDQLIAAGKFCVVHTIPPLALPAWSAARNNMILEINDAIRARVSRSSNMMVLIDLYAAMVDPMAANKGEAKPYMLKADGVHFTQRCCGDVIGQLWYNAFKNLPLNDYRIVSNSDVYTVSSSSSNLHPIGPWTNTRSSGTGVTAPATGLISDGASGSVKGSAAVAYSMVARQDGFGFDIQALITSTLNEDGMRISSNNLSTTPLQKGDLFQISATVKVSNIPGSLLFSTDHFAVVSLPSGSITVQCMYSAGSTGLECVQNDYEMLLRSPKVRLPAVPTGIFTRTETRHSAGAGTQLTVKVGRYASRYGRDATKFP